MTEKKVIQKGNSLVEDIKKDKQKEDVVSIKKRMTKSIRVKIVNCDLLNIRRRDDQQTIVVGQIDNGEVVTVEEAQSSAWYKVNHRGKTGYIMRKFTKEI